MIQIAAQAAAQIAVRIIIQIAILIVHAIHAAPVHQAVRRTAPETAVLQLAEAIAAQIRLAETEKAAAHNFSNVISGNRF